MELTPERKKSIRRRLEPMLAEFDPELCCVEIIVDARRENLGVILQKADRPAMLRLDFVRYVSMSDAELRSNLAGQLRTKRIIPG